MSRQLGIAHLILLIIIVVVLIIAAVLVFLGLRASSALKPKADQNTPYQNPFNQPSSYQNPFETYQNPFADIEQ
ncbi:hypothetical protein HYT18_03130 [Candidatus Microgenomates bacterium]|nr:hypothetical protein [Candidatus Microgenomates bacterium]